MRRNIFRIAAASLGTCHSIAVSRPGISMATLIHTLCASNPTKVIPSIAGSFRMRLWRLTRQSAVRDGCLPSLSPFRSATLRLEPAFSSTRGDLAASAFAPSRRTLCMNAPFLGGRSIRS